MCKAVAPAAQHQRLGHNTGISHNKKEHHTARHGYAQQPSVRASVGRRSAATAAVPRAPSPTACVRVLFRQPCSAENAARGEAGLDATVVYSGLSAELTSNELKRESIP